MTDADLLEKFGFKEEYTELARDNIGDQVYGHTGFPDPKHAYKLVYETPHKSIEDHYFWILEELRVGNSHHFVTKITDLFSASEQSSFFGTAQQRIGLQQEKVSMFLATIGKMVKELFQLVREIRVLRERLSYYEDALKTDSPSRISAEITLKGIWVDMVEQGAKNPASVYGMARELQFVTLPDLFYSIHPKTPQEVDALVDKTEFNRKVKEVLKRKLRQFAEWKVSTYDEIKNRHLFTLKYLRQHFDIIKMYMNWVKPYLRNIQRMEMEDKTRSVDLINAFEGSVVEIEFLAKMFPRRREVGMEIVTNRKVYSVVLMHFHYRTKPQMNYMQEYQRGPLHVGQCEMDFRAYAWTQKDIDRYLKMKDEEDLRLLASIDSSVKAAMESLGDELEMYLKEAGEKVDFASEFKKKDAKEKVKSALDPFTSIFRGFGEIVSSVIPKSRKKDGLSKIEFEEELDLATKKAKATVWVTYKNFKKKEGLIAW